MEILESHLDRSFTVEQRGHQLPESIKGEIGQDELGSAPT
jgi:hypothetical protein